MYPGFARVGALIEALALFAGMSICTSTTPPQREESPESRRLFGAVWGAQPQRTPGGIMTNHKSIAKEAPTRCGASFRISELRSCSRRDRHKETRKPKVNPPKADNRANTGERANGDLDPAEQDRKLSQAVSFSSRRKKTGVSRWQSAATEPQGQP